MQQEVFSRTDVAAALATDFVPVKLNADHFPTKVREYGVTVLPTDVILSPDGRVVEKMTGSADPSAYLGRLRQVAASWRSRAAQKYAQMAPPASSSPRTGEQASVDGRAGGGYSPGGQPAASGGRYGGLFTRPAESGPPAVSGARQPPPSSPSAYAANRYDPGVAARDTAPPSRPGPATPSYGGQALSRQAVAAPPGVPSPSGRAATPPRDRFASSGAPAAPAYGAPRPSYGGPIAEGRAAVQTQAQGAATSEPPGAGRSPGPAALPAGSPPLALEGFCPVQLSESERWVRGDQRWGVRHRGGTYLFAGPDEQRRFFADPDRYSPVLSGNDVVLAVDESRSVAGRREHGAWFQGRVYLFSSETSFQRFSVDPERYEKSVEQSSPSLARRGYAPPPVMGSTPSRGSGYGNRY